tara:strand:- start:217 stop:834 length:618 start_codon:yes stop_codon:yes gene_type:complete
MMKTIDEIFDDITLIGETPNLIFKTQLPDKIFDEVKLWIEPMRKIKDDPYAELLNHRNGGTDHNSYQIAVPRSMIDHSFFYGYILHFGQIYLRSIYPSNETFKDFRSRAVQLRNYSGHYDGYDCWLNFTYKGDDNPVHSHAGSLSSIIYIKDKDCEPTHFPSIGYVHEPKEGEILLFPSHLNHYVATKQTDSERISASFNLDVFG